MRTQRTRRQVLKAIAAWAGGAALVRGQSARGQSAHLRLGGAAPFSFDRLRDAARRLAGAPYREPAHPVPAIIDKIDYENWGKISFNPGYALLADGPGPFPVSFFHLGKFFPKRQRIHVVDHGSAREIQYSPRYFRMPEDSVAKSLGPDVGFAGIRVQEARGGSLDWRTHDWVAFLGASYFRAIGELHQYGLSARGIALDTAVFDRAEEFPDFTDIYIDTAERDDGLTVYALLEGPSIAGAYRFELTRGAGVLIDVEASLYPRKAVSRFGIAPLTSMYWFSETAKPTAIDWRPEVHDSDGLAMWTGWGEHLWRPLNNPPRSMASSFSDENPKGFGLLQRDRLFDHYQDGVFYDRRPSLWVEPRGSWGKGAVQLIELPTDDEIHDNIVAVWVPEKTPQPGTSLDIGYRLYWLADEPHPTDLARCVATRLGNGGQPGLPRPTGVRKFVVEFLGGPLINIPAGTLPEMLLQSSRGHFTDYKVVEAVPDEVRGHWRAEFDLAGVEGTEPVELRLQLAVHGQVVSETWLFQYHPLPSP
jgi:glucans biosynthesis protein